MKHHRAEYLAAQLDKVREALQYSRSPWGRQWLAALEQRLLRQIQWASL